MPRDDAVYVGHMLDMARKAAARVTTRSRADFDADEDLRFALAHLVQTVGEAASRVSAAYRASHPEIPWRQITGIRHRIVHDYMNVDYDVIWVVVSQELPQLITDLQLLLPPGQQ